MPSLPRIRRTRARDTVVAVSAPPSPPAELTAAGLTWIHLDAPSLNHAQDLAADPAAPLGQEEAHGIGDRGRIARVPPHRGLQFRPSKLMRQEVEHPEWLDDAAPAEVEP